MLTTQAIIKEPSQKATHSIIWLHGLGADGHDFVPVINAVTPTDHAIRFIFPHANIRPVTINGSRPMRAWYDLYGLKSGSRQDEAGLRLAEQAINGLIQQEIDQGIPSDHIFLAGFSQGGAMALHSGLRFPDKLAGIIALSCYLPLHEFISNEGHAANKTVPIFMAHGSTDSVLTYAIGEQSHQYLERCGYLVNFHTYAMDHCVCEQELADIKTFISKHL